MRRCRRRPMWWGLLLIVACLSACGHGGGGGKPNSSSASPSRSAGAAGSLPPGAIGVSPTGVTTKVDVPADSTEEEYFQACHAAKVWMDGQPGSGQGVIEPYLGMVQASPSGVAGTWNVPWSDLSPARQSAVIVAASAAANGECG
ncbi:lipoprotein LpqV [Mycobacterium kubicae]|uniref:lipoprotein LpqV n=1 Tax=Mycobacterium kubicae TaxID=120959 RepID=UPI000E32062D